MSDDVEPYLETEKTLRRHEQTNLVKYVMAGTMNTIAASLCSEGYIQALLLEFENGTRIVSIYGVLIQLAGVLGYSIYLFDSPFKRGFQCRFALFAFLQMLLPFFLSGIIPDSKVPWVVFASGFVYYFSLAYRGASEQSVVPLLFAKDAYAGALLRISVLGAVASVLLSVFVPGGNSVLMLCSSMGFVGTSLIVMRYRMRPARKEEMRVGWKDMIRCFTVKKFLPHFIRGWSMAGIYYFSVYGQEKVVLNEREKNSLIFLFIGGTLLGNLIYRKMAEMISGKIACIAFLGCMLCFLICPLLTVPAAFLIGYFFMTTFNSMSAMAVTVGVLKSTPNKDLPFVSAIRMLLMNGACAVGNVLFAFLYGMVWKESVIVLSVVFLTLTAFLFQRSLTDNWES